MVAVPVEHPLNGRPLPICLTEQLGRAGAAAAGGHRNHAGYGAPGRVQGHTCFITPSPAHRHQPMRPAFPLERGHMGPARPPASPTPPHSGGAAGAGQLTPWAPGRPCSGSNRESRRSGRAGNVGRPCAGGRCAGRAKALLSHCMQSVAAAPTASNCGQQQPNRELGTPALHPLHLAS